MNKMYIKKARTVNLGVIKSAEIDFQLDDAGNPKPVLLVGPNGSGKTLFLASIVDSLIEAINSFHSADNQHQFMSSDYIRDSADYVWRQVEFTTEHFFYSLALNSPKTSGSSLECDDETIQNVYDDMSEEINSRSSHNFVGDHGFQSVFFR